MCRMEKSRSAVSYFNTAELDMINVIIDEIVWYDEFDVT